MSPGIFYLALDGLRYFIVVLPESSISLFYQDVLHLMLYMIPSKCAKSPVMSTGTEKIEYLNNPWLHNELLLSCVINSLDWFSSNYSITGYNHFVPVRRTCVVMSSCEIDIEKISDMPTVYNFKEFPYQSAHYDITCVDSDKIIKAWDA